MTPEEELAKLKKKVAKRKKENKYFLFGTICMIFGILLGALLVVGHASAAHDYYEVKPTIDSNPIHQADYKLEQQWGTIKVILECGSNTLSPTFTLKNEDANITKEYSIGPGGYFEDQFSVGNYTPYLPDGNGGQPEYGKTFRVNAQQTNYVVWLGHAISPPESSKVSSKPTVKPTVTPTPTQHCTWHEGRWQNSCDNRHHCHIEWIPGYWDCGGCN